MSPVPIRCSCIHPEPRSILCTVCACARSTCGFRRHAEGGHASHRVADEEGWLADNLIHEGQNLPRPVVKGVDGPGRVCTAGHATGSAEVRGLQNIYMSMDINTVSNARHQRWQSEGAAVKTGCAGEGAPGVWLVAEAVPKQVNGEGSAVLAKHWGILPPVNSGQAQAQYACTVGSVPRQLGWGAHALPPKPCMSTTAGPLAPHC